MSHESDVTEFLLGWARVAPRWKGIAFMASCLQRMVPNYDLFVQATGFGDRTSIRNALDRGWQAAAGDDLTGDVDYLLTKVLAARPETEQHSSIFTSAALDAAVTAALVLEAVQHYAPRQVEEVSLLARDTVDLWIQERRRLDPSDPTFEHTIMTDALMRAELDAQRAAIRTLDSPGRAPQTVVAELRAYWSEPATGSLGVALG